MAHHNDRALLLAQETGWENRMLFLRADEVGTIRVFLKCNDLFHLASSDLEELPPDEWALFEKEYDRALMESGAGLSLQAFQFFGEAYAVKLRGCPPHPVVLERTAIGEMLDFLGVDPALFRVA